MKEKKMSADWYVAATHYLTAGFVMPLLIGIIASAVIMLLPVLEVISMPLSLVLSLLSIWFGVWYSAGYLKKTHIIKDPNKIIKLSTIYLVVIQFLYCIYLALAQDIVLAGIQLVSLVIMALIFYFASKKYIVETIN